MKKVLFFSHPGASGSQRMTVTIAKLLPRNEFDVKYVIMDKPGGRIESFIPKDYPIIYVPIRNIWDFTALRMARVMQKEHADIVFCSLRYMAIHMILGAKMCFRKIDCIVRSDNDMKRGKWYNYGLMKLTFPWCKWIIGQQEEMRQEIIDVLHLDPDKVIALQNPLDRKTIDSKLQSTENPYPHDDAINYVWVGRFNLTKGQDILTKAFSIVHKQQPQSHLYLVGAYNVQSEVYKRVQQTIEHNALESFVHLVGYDDNPYKWMKNCSVFVLPSRFEGLPNALIEAMYCGAPVVAAECIPVVSRIVDDGKNGYVVPKENPELMADAMMKASRMEKVKFTYNAAEPNDFINLFR